MTTKRVSAIGLIKLRYPDGEQMTGDDGEPTYARAHSPASKLWQVLDTARERKKFRKLRENKNRTEALADMHEENVEFIKGAVEEFINFPSGLASEPAHGKRLVEIVIDDPELGYLRDQLQVDLEDWGAFLPMSLIKPKSGFDSMSG